MVPKKNYELFLKATQMEIILEKLNKCVQLYNKYKAKLTVSTKVSRYKFGFLFSLENLTLNTFSNWNTLKKN